MKGLCFVLVCVAALVASCGAQPTSPPSPSVPPPTPTGVPITAAEQLAGVWESRHPSLYLLLTEDGIYHLAATSQAIAQHPTVQGQYWFEGDILFMEDTSAMDLYDGCLGAPAGSYEVRRTQPADLVFVAVDEPCESRAEALVEPFRMIIQGDLP